MEVQTQDDHIVWCERHFTCRMWKTLQTQIRNLLRCSTSCMHPITKVSWKITDQISSTVYSGNIFLKNHSILFLVIYISFKESHVRGHIANQGPQSNQALTTCNSSANESAFGVSSTSCIVTPHFALCNNVSPWLDLFFKDIQITSHLNSVLHEVVECETFTCQQSKSRSVS